MDLCAVRCISVFWSHAVISVCLYICHLDRSLLSQSWFFSLHRLSILCKIRSSWYVSQERNQSLTASKRITLSSRTHFLAYSSSFKTLIYTEKIAAAAAGRPLVTEAGVAHSRFSRLAVLTLAPTNPNVLIRIIFDFYSKTWLVSICDPVTQVFCNYVSKSFDK